MTCNIVLSYNMSTQFDNSFALDDFQYDLPLELIAQEPIPDRQKSRLMVLEKSTGQIHHMIFDDIVHYMDPGDCLVLNDTKVIPARLLGNRISDGKDIEFFLINKQSESKDNLNGDIWEILVRPGKRARPDASFVFGNGLIKGTIISILKNGNRLAKLEYFGEFMQVLQKAGTIPLPPYIKKKLTEPGRYQTVYAKIEGSVAAPTAGLHFTDELLDTLRQKGIKLVFITLHVGPGTFKPVKAADIREHLMHPEFYDVSSEAAHIINETVSNSGKVFAVGTTSCRVLETISDCSGHIEPGSGFTDIFIYPGYRFKLIKGLITNFHLPGSTLIMLVSAFAGRENVMSGYDFAIKEKYRFYSFGDAMLLI